MSKKTLFAMSRQIDGQEDIQIDSEECIRIDRKVDRQIKYR